MTTPPPPNERLSAAVVVTVIVAALGYFVDIYDLILFSVVRIKSLASLGITDAAMVKEVGLTLINWQMWGMLLGGLLWGILGDKSGRLSVLFGSILLYSLANIANGMVGWWGGTDAITQYKVLRLVAGIGLAGELGAGITLVSEVMNREHRGYGTTIVAAVGLTGAIFAYFVNYYFDWRTAYFVGGGLGLLLLVLRISVAESGMFGNMAQQQGVERGNLLTLLSHPNRAFRYLSCILIGLPTWFVIGILASFSPEFGKALGITASVDAGKAVMWAYVGLVVGDIASGIISQWWRSRRKVMLLFQLLSAITVAYYLTAGNIPLSTFYGKAFLLGVGVGYWAMFVTIASEQFGTNVRALVTTTVPNFVRGSLPLITMAFKHLETTQGTITAAYIVGSVCIGISVLFLYKLPETFGKDLDYVEK